MVTSAQALDLLAQNTNESSGKRWPELAHMDCFSCHHDLQSTSWRQSPLNLEKRRPGSLMLSNWYFAMLPEIKSMMPPAGDGTKAMAVWPANLFKKDDRALLADQAKILAKVLRKTAAAPLALVEPGSCSVLPLLQRFCDNRSLDRSWDETTQRYLALLALRQMQLDNKQAEDAGLNEFIEKLAKDVTFERGVDSPVKWAPKK